MSSVPPSGTVTFVLSDVEGSTRLWESSPTLASAVLARYRGILEECVGRCNGALPLEQGEGDSAVSAFSRPSDAVLAAQTAQRALADEAWPDGVALKVRMAVHTGEVQLRDDGTYAGIALNRCARLRALAHGGQVLVSSSTHDLLEDRFPSDLYLVDLGVHRLRDLTRPERIWQLCGPGLVQDHPALRSLDARPNNLPVQLSSFIGRDADIPRGVALLDETRILTLTGAGGCGKTRLAQRIAAEVIDKYPNGVWWIELAPVGDADLIGSCIAAALGLKVPPGRTPLETLTDTLGTASTLIVLDNCEHLVAGAAKFVDGLLRSSSLVAVVATSREPLGVEGEVTWRVPSLDSPTAEHASVQALEQYDAVRLFIDRALQARPNFRITNDNAPAVAQICYRLDGIPLAIELAAARTRVLSPERIAAGLDDRFKLLTGHNRIGVPRQQTLLASVDWSHELLDTLERALFRRLGIFAGGFTLDSAEAVAAFEPLSRYDVLEVLTRLADKSLVQVDESYDSGGRYRFLETIRQYALDRLGEAGETSLIRERHLSWACRLAADLEADTTDARPAALDQLDREHPNLRSALEWSMEADRRPDALNLVASLTFFWAQRGHYSEAATWESRLFDDAGDTSGAGAARARWGCAYVRFYAGDSVGSFERATVALAEARAEGDLSTAARCLHTLATAMVLSDPSEARRGLLEAVSLARGAGDEWCLADALQIVGCTYLVEGDHRSAGPVFEEAFEICDRHNNLFQLAWHRFGLAFALLLRGEIECAEHEIREGLCLARLVGDPTVEVWACDTLCTVLIAKGTPDAVEDVVKHMADARHEWGALGEALIPTFLSRAALLTDPGVAAQELEATGAALIESGDSLDGSHLMEHAALAALEAGRPDDAARLATVGEKAAPTAYYRALARLIHGVAAGIVGDPEAIDLIHESLGDLVERDILFGVPLALETLGGLSLDRGSASEGTRLLAAAETLRRQTGQGRLPTQQTRFDDDVRVATELLADDFTATWEAASKVPVSEAVAYARRARGDRRRPSSGWESLTPAENQVVELAALGLTNPEIGKRLFMGRGTVKTHLSHIYAKLNIGSRAELAAAATSRSAAQAERHDSATGSNRTGVNGRPWG